MISSSKQLATLLCFWESFRTISASVTERRIFDVSVEIRFQRSLNAHDSTRSQVEGSLTQFTN